MTITRKDIIIHDTTSTTITIDAPIAKIASKRIKVFVTTIKRDDGMRDTLQTTKPTHELLEDILNNIPLSRCLRCNTNYKKIAMSV